MARKSTSNRQAAAQESAWYATPEGRKQTQREFERAVSSGKILRSKGSRIPPTDLNLLAELVEKAKANATKPVSIRLPITDLERAREIAAKEGVGYQTVLKRAIRAGLRKVS